MFLNLIFKNRKLKQNCYPQLSEGKSILTRLWQTVPGKQDALKMWHHSQIFYLASEGGA